MNHEAPGASRLPKATQLVLNGAGFEIGQTPKPAWGQAFRTCCPGNKMGRSGPQMASAGHSVGGRLEEDSLGFGVTWSESLSSRHSSSKGG